MALQQNLYMDQGADFSIVISLTNNTGTGPLDLTGSTMACQMRKSYTSSTAITINALMYDAVNGQIQLYLSNTVTTNIKPGRYVYDVEVVQTGVKTRVIEGLIIVSPQVTQV